MFRVFERDRVRAYALAMILSATAALVASRTGLQNDARATLLVFLAVVCVSAWAGGLWPGLLATVLTAAASDYLVLPPLATLEIDRPADALVLVWFIGVGGLASLLADRAHGGLVREHRFRAQAERQARQAHRIHELTSALSRAQSPDDVVDGCVHEVAFGAAADAALVALVTDDGEWGEIARAVGYNRELLAAASRFSLAMKSPLTDAIRNEEPVILPSAHARRSLYPELAPGNPLAAHEAIAAFPLMRGRRALGALLVAFNVPKSWTDDERRFLSIAAERTSQALERARRQQSAERAREDAEMLRARAHQELADRLKMEAALRDSEAKYRALAARTSRLHALTAALSEAVTLDAVARAVVRQGKVVAGATGGSVVLLTDENRVFETLYAEEHAQHTVEAWHRFPVEPGLSATSVVETRHPVFVRSFADWQQRFWRSATMAADNGYASAAALPLIVENAVIGVLSFHFTAPVNFDEEYAALLTSVAQHATQALDRARLYEAAQRARAAAEAANRLKDDFLSTVSHELRAPLNAILGWTSMLRSGSLDETRTARAIDSIFANASRQTRLIDELLDVARIVAGRAVLDLHEIDLAETIRGAVDAVMPAAHAKGVELHFETDAHVRVMGDAQRLEQVFLNLVSNGVKFTSKGGRVTVEITSSGRSADIVVADTGIGIDPEFLPHVFERFRQADSSTSRRYGGLGLGLSIAHHLVVLHGGTIRADSAGAGRGTTFTVSLPVTAAEEARVTPPARPGKPVETRLHDGTPDLEGVRVLVVDDESDARELVQCALERCGATVVPASSSRDALETLASTDVDVLLADIAMPDEDGYAFIRKVRSLAPGAKRNVPAAAVTSCVREDERQQALDAGFQMHLPKPIDPASLAESVAELLRKSA